MNVANADIPSGRLQALAKQSGIIQAIFHDFSVSRESEMDEIAVLGDYLSTRPGEIKSVGLFCSAEVVELEDEVLR